MPFDLTYPERSDGETLATRKMRSICALSEDLTDLVQPVDEAVDLVAHRVEVEAGAVRRRNAKLLHQRLAAVVAGADCNAFAVEDLRDVVRMDPFDVEGDDPGSPVGRGAVGLHPRQLGQLLEAVGGELVLVLLDRFQADLADVVDCGPEADRL